MGYREFMSNAPSMERAVIKVDTVDVENRVVHGIDKMGGKFSVSYTFTDGLFQIPQSEERWAIIRHGWQWHLDQRMDRPDEADIKHASKQGDTHLRSPGTLHVDSKGLQINSNALGTTIWERIPSAASQGSYVLTNTCVNSKSIQVFVNGVLKDPLTVILSADGNSLIFSPPVSGLVVIYYQR